MPKPKAVLRGITRNSDQAAMAVALKDDRADVTTQISPASSQPSFDGDITTTYRVGEKYPVPLGLLVRSANNARVFYSAAELEEMSTTLKRDGQDVPALGYVKNGRVVLFDGVKRMQSAPGAELQTLNVEIRPPPESESSEYAASRRVNLLRSAQTAIDDAVRWKEMLAKGTYKDQDDLSEKLEISKATVSKTMGLNRIPERLLKMMCDHPQTRQLTIAYEISSIFAAEKFKDTPDLALDLAQEVIEETVKSELSRQKLQDLIASKINGPKTRIRGEAMPVKYGDNKGTLKIVPSKGSIQLAFTDLPPEKVEELRVRIEQMLSGQLSM